MLSDANVWKTCLLKLVEVEGVSVGWARKLQRGRRPRVVLIRSLELQTLQL